MRSTCEPYRVRVPLPVMVTVNAFVEDRVELQDVLGLDLQQELVTLLEQKGESLGWIRDSLNEHIFVKQIHPEVSIQIDVSQSPIRIERRASARVEESLRDPAKRDLDELLKQVEPEYNLALNELWNRVYIEAVNRAVHEMGYYVEEKVEVYDEQTCTHTLKIYLTG